jgi:hypothetical protein
MIAAAAVAAVAGSASAQALYQAEIPLSYRVEGQMMLPGAYEIEVARSAGGTMLRLFNRDTGKSALLQARGTADVAKGWAAGGAPVLEFACTEKACALTKMWDGRNNFAYFFNGLRMRGGLTRREFVETRKAALRRRLFYGGS